MTVYEFITDFYGLLRICFHFGSNSGAYGAYCGIRIGLGTEPPKCYEMLRNVPFCTEVHIVKYLKSIIKICFKQIDTSVGMWACC